MTKTNQKIPEGWSVKKLGEICKNKGLYGANAPSVPYSPNLPLYIRITDIDDDGKYIFSNRVSVNISDYKNYLLKKGDIVFARTGATTGKTYLYNENDGQFVFAGFLIKFSPNTNLINPYYLKLSTEMPFYKSWIKVMSVRSGQPGVNAEEYAKYPLLLPPLPEQEKIAEILGTWDFAIEKLTALIEQKKLLKKGLMQRLLTGKQRLPGFSEPWKKVKLGECFSFLKTSSYSRAETTDCGEVHYIHYGDIHTKYPLHIFPKDINIYISTKQASKSDCLKTGDLILLDASEDYEGTTKCVELLNISDDEKVVSGLHTLALRDSTQNFINGFRAYITSIPFVKNNFWKQVTGIKVYGVSKDNLKKIKIPIPSLSEQKAIADILSKADEEIDLLTAKLSALKSQKKGLMQKLLTGQIRVKVA